MIVGGLSEGLTVLHYRVLAKLGEGGMGAVYKAEDTKLGRLVALKRVAPHVSGDATARARLLREARAASALSHPCIVTVYAIEESSGLDFIAMELVDGEPLDALVARGPVPLAQIVALGADIADALDAAHRAGVVHRDMKPGNVMVTPSGRAKVLDFGIATLAADGAVSPVAATAIATGDGKIIGTVPYMAPEQLRGGPLDGRADVFALGCILFEMATGRRAFDARDAVALVHDIAAVDPPKPSSLAPGLPAAFDAVVARALAKDPSQRFASAADVGAALRALASAPASVPASGDLAQATPSAPRLSTARDQESLDLYVKGRELWSRRPGDVVWQAIACFEKAVARDAGFSDAWAALAEVYATLGSWESGVLPHAEAQNKARSYAERALALDPKSANAQATLAYAILHHDWDVRRAETAFRTALDMDPSLASAHHWYAHALVAAGRFEAALVESKVALASDSKNLLLNAHVAWHFFMARAPDRALEHGERTIAMEPRFTGATTSRRGERRGAAMRTARSLRCAKPCGGPTTIR